MGNGAEECVRLPKCPAEASDPLRNFQYTSGPMRHLVLVLTLVATPFDSGFFARSETFAQGKRLASFEDVLNIKAIQGATISPDGKWVIYGVRQWVDEQDPSTQPRSQANDASLRAGKVEARAHIWK